MTDRASPGPGGTLAVRQVRSAIGEQPRLRRTLRALGLNGVGRVRTLPDNPQVRGMLSKIPHLVEVEERRVDADGQSRGD